MINTETGGTGVNFQAEDVLLVSGTIFVSAVNQTCTRSATVVTPSAVADFESLYLPGAVSYEPAISCKNCTGAYNITISAGNNVTCTP